MLIKIRQFIAKKLIGSMPVALNITVYDWGIDMGASASISGNVKFKQEKEAK